MSQAPDVGLVPAGLDLTQLRTSSDGAALGPCTQGLAPPQLSVTLPLPVPCDTALTALSPSSLWTDVAPRLPVRQRLPSTICNCSRSSVACHPLPATPPKPPPWGPWRHPSSAAVGP